MPTRCTRCRARDGAHQPWCIQAVLWERLSPVAATPTDLMGPLPVWDGVEEFEESIATEVSSELVAQLRAELGALTGNRDMLVEANANLGAQLDEARDRLEAAQTYAREETDRLRRELEAARAARPAASPADMAVIDTQATALQAELNGAKRSVGEQQHAIRVLQAELRTAQQQRDHALADRDKARKALNDPAMMREHRRQEAERIRGTVREAAAARPPIVVDRDAGETYEDVQRQHPETVAEKAARVQREALSAEPEVTEAVAEVTEAVAEVEAAGATVEVVEPVAAEVVPAELSEAEQRSQEASNLLAAAELFVGEFVGRQPGARLTNPALLAAFEAWLPTIEFERKWSTSALVQRQLGLAMGKAGYAKRQVRDPETNTAPMNYLGAALKAADTSRGSVHPGRLSPPATFHDEPDPVKAISDMRRAAQAAKRPDRHTALGGHNELPGREIKNDDLRKWATTLVSEQGWTYKRPNGRGHPRLISPDGQIKKLSTTPGDQRGIIRAKMDLRRMGASLP